MHCDVFTIGCQACRLRPVLFCPVPTRKVYHFPDNVFSEIARVFVQQNTPTDGLSMPPRPEAVALATETELASAERTTQTTCPWKALSESLPPLTVLVINAETSGNFRCHGSRRSVMVEGDRPSNSIVEGRCPQEGPDSLQELEILMTDIRRGKFHSLRCVGTKATR
jgi:hypothetical protein